MFKNKMISVVIPAKNEADNILDLVHEIVSVIIDTAPFEIVYIDDGSTDNTSLKVLEAQELYPEYVRLLHHEKSLGQSTSIYTGVSHANGDIIVTLDADGQNNPTDITKLLNAALNLDENSDYCIAGYRKSRKDTPWKRFQSRVANGIRSRVLNDNTPDTGCGLKVFPRRTFLKLPYFDHMHRYIPALVKRLGGKIEVVEVTHRDRQHGISKYGMWGRLFAGLIDLLGVMWLQKRAKIPVVKEYKR